MLSFILKEEAYKPFQKLFFSFLLEKYHDDFFRAPLLIDTRKIYSNGTPDLIIDNQKDTVILIENKFYANLSGANQISRYKAILVNDYETFVNKYLILLIVKHRKCFYEEEIIKDFSSSGTPIKTIEELQDYLKVEYKINFKFLFWQDILELFNCEDIIIKSLQKYISHYFIGEVEFMKQEIAILKNPAFITAYKKIF
ncbi:MAG: PD-(D/E)XK nuclease family protein, partial [Candidatus Absconditabacterales bacterium]|nr:PD-(D/E)XK nuclease family protein [Candidatus Absconditabacterales bacterium]